MRPRREMPPEEVAKIVEMRNDGKPWRVVADEVGCSTFYARLIYVRETNYDKYLDQYRGGSEDKPQRKKTKSKLEMMEEDYENADWRHALFAINATQRFMEAV